jgi:hypothetical protein
MRINKFSGHPVGADRRVRRYLVARAVCDLVGLARPRPERCIVTDSQSFLHLKQVMEKLRTTVMRWQETFNLVASPCKVNNARSVQ